MIKQIAISFISGLCASIIFIALHNNMYSKNIGVVRMADLLGSHITSQGAEELTTQQLEKRAKYYSQALDTALEEISNEYKVLLLVDPAVVSNSPDYTDIIKDKIDEKLSAENL